jgi:hypothetical protein
MQARIFRSLADSTDLIARNLKMAALDLRTFTVQYFARLFTKQDKFMKNQKLASGTIQGTKFHAQLTPQIFQNIPHSQSETLR